jgi:hypothetical protein
MNISVLLDVVIGMTYLFLVFSILASAINELIAAILDSRSKLLRYGFRRLLGANGAVADKAVVDKVFDHPAVAFFGRQPTFLDGGIALNIQTAFLQNWPFRL